MRSCFPQVRLCFLRGVFFAEVISGHEVAEIGEKPRREMAQIITFITDVSLKR